MDSTRLNLSQREGFLESLFQLLPSSTGAPCGCGVAWARLGVSNLFCPAWAGGTPAAGKGDFASAGLHSCLRLLPFISQS